jgi:hypothetical protein
VVILVMAVTQMQEKNYNGLSTDDKPTVGVYTGDNFFEVDSSKQYKFNGTTWVEWIQRVTVVS